MTQLRKRFPMTSRDCCLAVLLVGCSPACSTASAAGCLSGMGAGMALAGIAVASTNSQPQQAHVDGGTAVLGGLLFGAVSGCTAAAVADAIASSGHKKRESVGVSEPESDSSAHAPTLEQRPPERVLSAQARLDDLVVTLLCQADRPLERQRELRNIRVTLLRVTRERAHDRRRQLRTHRC